MTNYYANHLTIWKLQNTYAQLQQLNNIKM